MENKWAYLRPGRRFCAARRQNGALILSQFIWPKSMKSYGAPARLAEWGKAALRKQGYFACVCKGWEMAAGVIEQYMEGKL